MAQFLRHYLLALQFFTRIPLGAGLARWVGFSPALLRASAAHFPGIGWLVGALAVACGAGLLRALPVTSFSVLVVAALTTVLTLLLTGAFHEDGLADVADALGGTQERERALAIMKDSRVGAFGAIAVAMALLLKVALLALLGACRVELLWVALFLGHVLSRTWPLFLIRLLPHVGDTAASKSKPLADQISRASLLLGCAWAAAAMALVVWLVLSLAPALQAELLRAVQVAVFASGCTAALMGRWFAHRLQGFTGDCLGATQQVCELAFYLGLALGVGP